MKYSLILSALVYASMSFAAPVQTVSDEVDATTTEDSAPMAETAPVVAAPATTDTAVSTTAIQAPSEARITGVLETRPTVTAKGPNNVTTENTVGLGYQFNPNFEIGAVQYVDTNIRSNKLDRNGADVIIQDAFVRAKFNNIYQTDTLSFGYEPRVYLPTKQAFRDAGGNAVFRNYFKLAYKASNSVTLTLMDVPILQSYGKAGVGAQANPAFENRVYLIADFNLGKGFALSLPLYFHQTKNRLWNQATRSGKWDHFVYTWPELTYAASDNVTVGVAYYSDNFMTADMRGLDIGAGLKKGAFQAIMGVTL